MEERIVEIPEVVRFGDLPAPEPIDTSGALPARDITWHRILREEPAILDVFAELQKTPGDSDYARWHAFVAKHGTTPKAALSKLVGWRARNPRLRSTTAYQIVMEHMWDLLL